jgi:hypothetical protein
LLLAVLASATRGQQPKPGISRYEDKEVEAEATR